jgi:hypothetical protein
MAFAFFFKVLHLDFRASQQKLQQFNMADEGADAPQGADAPEGANAPKALTFPKAPTPKGASRCSRHYVEAAGIGFDRRAAGFWLVPTAAQLSFQHKIIATLHCPKRSRNQNGAGIGIDRRWFAAAISSVKSPNMLHKKLPPRWPKRWVWTLDQNDENQSKSSQKEPKNNVVRSK